MKKTISLLLAVILVLSAALTVSALDVKDSEADYYDHEETGVTIPYRLVVPEIYDERYVFPLVVYFHGAGERGFENERQLDYCVQSIADNMQKAIILAPQCTHEGQWVDTPWTEGCYSTDEVPESDELMAVMDLVEKICQEYSVDRDTIYAAGYSMGGFAVWDVMVRHNDVFAAGVAVCGGGDPSKAEILKDTPMFVYHGDADDLVPYTASADTVAAIQAAGGTKVVYTEMSGQGHGIWETVYKQESLYQQLKKCKLSDRYTPEPEPAETNGQYLLYILIGGGAVLAAAVTVSVICIVKRKKAKR